MRKRLLGPGGPLSVFHEYPVLLRLAGISVCAEIAWAILIVVLQYYFLENLLKNEAHQYVVSRVAIVTLAFTACETIFKVPMGRLSDKLGPRRLIYFALTISAISPLLMSRAHQWYYFIPLRAIDGVGAAALWPAMSSLMARCVPRQAKAAAMSVFNGAYCMGLALGPMLGLILGHKFGNNRVFPLCSAFMLLGILIAASVLKMPLADKPQAAPAPAPGHKEPVAKTSLLRSRPILVRMMILYALSQLAVGMIASVLFTYMHDQFGIEEGNLPKMIALPALGVAFLALPLGRVADSIGRPRAIWISYIMATIGMLMVASTSLFPPAHHLTLSLPMIYFSIGMLGLVGSYILGTPAWLGLTSVQADESRQAQALSLMQTSQGVGVVIGLGTVASAGTLLTRWEKVRVEISQTKFGKEWHETREAIGKHIPHLPPHWANSVTQHIHGLTPAAPAGALGPVILKSKDIVPITVWLWAAAAVFSVCLVGALLFVREPEHSQQAEEEAASLKQPLEITGV